MFFPQISPCNKMPQSNPTNAAKSPPRIRLKASATVPRSAGGRNPPEARVSPVVMRAYPIGQGPVGVVPQNEFKRSLGGFRQNESGETLPPERVTPPNAAKWGTKNMNLAKSAKTRLGNRKQMVRCADERDWRVRRAKELYFGMILDMGGIDNVSTLQDKFAKDLAFLIVMGEELQEGWISGREDFAPFLYINYIKTAAQLARQLGMKRVAKLINPKGKARPAESLDEFIAQQEPIIKEEPKVKRGPGRPRLSPLPEEPEVIEGEATDESEPTLDDDDGGGEV